MIYLDIIRIAKTKNPPNKADFYLISNQNKTISEYYR